MTSTSLPGIRLVIPTYRRVHEQATFLGLPEDWRKLVIFVTDQQDYKGLYAKYGQTTGAQFVVHPPEITSIAQKRAWILQNTLYERIVMLDDDLRFAMRPEPSDTKLVPAKPEDVGKALHLLSSMLCMVVHAGFSARQGNNHLPAGWVANTRMMYVLGYRPEEVRKHCELGRIEHREDMDYTLQLLRAGCPNMVLADICVDQRYNAPGGASASGRTVQQSNADADRLALLHPGLVRVVQKDYAGSVPRREVVVSWKKAYDSRP